MCYSTFQKYSESNVIKRDICGYFIDFARRPFPSTMCLHSQSQLRFCAEEDFETDIVLLERTEAKSASALEKALTASTLKRTFSSFSIPIIFSTASRALAGPLR